MHSMAHSIEGLMVTITAEHFCESNDYDQHGGYYDGGLARNTTSLKVQFAASCKLFARTVVPIATV